MSRPRRSLAGVVAFGLALVHPAHFLVLGVVVSNGPASSLPLLAPLLVLFGDAIPLGVAAVLASQQAVKTLPVASQPARVSHTLDGFALRTRPEAAPIHLPTLLALLALGAGTIPAIWSVAAGWATGVGMAVFSVVVNGLVVITLALMDNYAVRAAAQRVRLRGVHLQVDTQSLTLDETLQSEFDAERGRLRLRTTSGALDVRGGAAELQWLERQVQTAARAGHAADIPDQLGALQGQAAGRAASRANQSDNASA